MIKKAFEIKLQNGLDARTIALLVQIASKYDSSVYIEADGKKINAKSIMGMMTMGLNNGEEVVVAADGHDEEAALDEVGRFLSEN